MHPIFAKLKTLRIIPVAVIADADAAEPLAAALLAGGLPVVEITLRTKAGLEAIRRVRARGDLLVGAGTVLSVEQAGEASAAGAEFMVTPGFNPRVVDYCRENEIPLAPGVATPTDIEAALAAGLRTVKFFPAESFGGLATLKALSAPYPKLRFIPTGGITAANLGSYLAHPQVLACGGSWMVKADLIDGKKFGEITRLAREAVATAQA